jgi:peptidoglycan/LPS O-acetylase OafA/YrhL
MTAALNEVYGFDGKRFWINRFLRLVPPYLTVCFLTALAIRCYPLEAARFMPRWAYPATAADVAENLSIMPLAFGGLQFRYIEPAWTLAVEIIMYAILWIGMGEALAEPSFASPTARLIIATYYSPARRSRKGISHWNRRC